MRRTWGKIYKVSLGFKISFGAGDRSAVDARAIIGWKVIKLPRRSEGNREIRDLPPIVGEKVFSAEKMTTESVCDDRHMSKLRNLGVPESSDGISAPPSSGNTCVAV